MPHVQNAIKMMSSYSIILTVHLNNSTEVSRISQVSLLKKCLESCTSVGRILKWEELGSGSTEISKTNFAENVTPHLKELLLEVAAEVLLLNWTTFVNEWKSQTLCYYNDKELPWLMFDKPKEVLVNTHRNYHEHVPLPTFGHGTLTSSSYFVRYQTECNKTAYFYHDSQLFELEVQPAAPGRRHGRFPIHLKTRYSNFRNILVTNSSLILQLSAPMLLTKGFKRVLDAGTNNPSIMGKSNSIMMTFHNRTLMHEILARMWYRCRNNGLSINFVSMLIEDGSPPSLIHNWYSLEFKFVYLIEAILQRTFALHYQGADQFIHTVLGKSLEDGTAVENALSDLVHLCDRGHHFNLLPSFQLLFDIHHKMQLKKKQNLTLVPQHTQLIRRAIVTPTRILMWPPEVCVENRIIRNYSKEYALRVSFRDEDFLKLNAHPSFDDVVILSTVKPRCERGIVIGDRLFEFLAWSNSQIRDHGIWMYARDDKGISAAQIRQNMGDFSHIKCVPKLMARMGQCFSQTQDGGHMPTVDGNIIQEPDVLRGENPEDYKPYCFSDGVGRISTKTVEKICKKLNLEKIRSAYQIRYKGSKGMLLHDPTLKHCDIVLRDSMVKFGSNDSTLEICKTSKAIPVYLNRPLITILGQMGIEHHVFLRMQEDALTNLVDMFFDQHKAAHYLSSHQNLSGVDFEKLVDCGINPTVEPFFRSMLMAGHRSDVANILHKARLLVDPSEGRNMFGVMDETGKLQYGQVFVQYTKNLLGEETNEEKIVLKGKVLLTKNPCYQGGDVRVLEAIDVPELHHVVDCVVFPQNGPRPHPNEMSGSDLDGDEYTVIWKPDLVFRKDNHPASHFPVPRNKLIDRTIQVSDMVNFLCSFIGSDNIGVIASSHLAIADYVQGGVCSTTCQSIARKASIAVDFAKNGEKVVLTNNDKPEKYPDFMEKWDKKETYRSQKALGKLYRVCKTFCEVNISSNDSYKYVQFDPMLKYTGWEKYRTSALISLERYHFQLERILNTYGVMHECQAMSGCYDRMHNRYNMAKDKAEIVELVALNIKELWRVTRQSFMEEFMDKNAVDEQAIWQKASAWYMVTYQKKYPKTLSFPWIVANHLCQIKSLNIAAVADLPENPVFLELEKLAENSSIQLMFRDRIDAGILFKQQYNNINHQKLELAYSLLVHWTTVFVKDLTKYHYPNEPLRPSHVAKILSFLLNETQAKIIVNCEATSLIFAFLKLMVSVRFHKDRRSSIVPFFVPRLNIITKLSMEAYRHIALTRSLESLGVGDNWEPESVDVELHPTGILPSKILSKIYHIITPEEDLEPEGFSELFGYNFHNDNSHANARGISTLTAEFKKWSGLSQISIRQDGYKVFVSAFGQSERIKMLRAIINKGVENIVSAISKGIPPI